MREKTIEEKEYEVFHQKPPVFTVKDDTRPYMILYPEGWSGGKYGSFEAAEKSMERMWARHSCLRNIKMEKPVKEKVQFTI